MTMFIISTLAVLTLDQISKLLIQRQAEDFFPHDPLPGIRIDRVHNRGLMLHLLQKWRWVSLVIPLLVLLIFLFIALPFLLGMERGAVDFATGLLLGGALSNVIDRYTRGYVVDWIMFTALPGKRLRRLVFNIADFAIFTAVLWLIPFLL